MKRLFFLITLLTIGGVNYAQLTVASLFALQEKADAIISETENLVDRQRQQALMDLSALVTYAFDRLDGSLDDLDRKLTRKERNLYGQLETVLDRAETAISEQRTALFNDLDRSIGNAIADLPFTSNKPYPTKINIPFIGEGKTGDTRISLEGVRLDNEKNYIEINGVQSHKTIIEGKDRISFDIALSPEMISTGSENFVNFVLFKGRRKKFVFKSPFWVYPKHFASITFHYTYLKDVVTTIDRSQTKEVRSKDGCGWKERNWNIARVGSGDWRIIPESITVDERSQAPGGGDCYIDSRSESMIGAKVTARSDCRGIRRFNPKQGTTVCKYRWKEQLITPTEMSDSVTVNLTYNQALALTHSDFPYGIERFKKAVITYYNGQQYEFIDNNYNNGLISYLYDGVNTAIQVKSIFSDFSMMN